MAVKANATKPVSPSPYLRTTIILAVVAALLLIIANSAFWFNRYVFNTTNFTNITTTALLSDSSRNAIAGVMIDKALADRPRIQNAVEEPATKLISGVLDSNLAHNIVTRAVTRLQVTITSQNPQPVEIDFTSFKETATRILSAASNVTGNDIGEDRQFQVSDIPDKIVLLDPSKLPNIYYLGMTLLWLGPIALILGLGLLAYPLIRARTDLLAVQTALLAQGGIMVGGYLLALLLGPLFRPTVLAQVPDSNMRIVVENVYNAFLSTFNSQSTVLLILAVVLLLAGGGTWYYRARPSLQA